mgnify:CR=1 FL=1
MNNPFTGSGVALVTPFKTDMTIDHDAVRKLVRMQIDGGTDFLVVQGTTGESPTLSQEEKMELLQTVISENNGRLKIVYGVGGNNTIAVGETLKKVPAGVDGILSVSPYYNKPTQEGIYQHFKTVAEASPIPIILYNVPGRTASNMLPTTVARIANDCKNVIGIKEAAGDIVQAMKLIQCTPNGFLVISGDDMITLPMVLAGGAGVISVIGEGFPKEFSEMVRLGLQRKVDQAYQLHYKLADAIDMIFEQGNPAGIKEVFKSLGLSENTVRLPLVSVNDDLASRLNNFTNSNS